MAKHQLTISPSYVPDWTYIQAVRELFQNSLDNEIEDKENKAYFDYKGDTLYIGSTLGKLEESSLLMGYSTKRNNSKTIGKHGEGYKVALMVLLREGKEVVIRNNGANETWKTRLVGSRKYGGEKLVEIDIVKRGANKKKEKHAVVYEISGVTEEEYFEIVKSNLHIQEDYNTIELNPSPNYVGSEILSGDEHKGHIYVNGLFVCIDNKFEYGYNLSPNNISLDRDRRLVTTFDISIKTSQLWNLTNEPKIISDLLMAEKPDVAYIKNFSGSVGLDFPDTESSLMDKVKKEIKKDLVAKHGENIRPVSDTKQLNSVMKVSPSTKPVIVPSKVQEFVVDDEELGLPVEVTGTTEEKLAKWFAGVRHKLNDQEVDEFEDILEEMTPF